MTEPLLFERIRRSLSGLESRVEARVPGSGGGISEGRVRRLGDEWRQLTLEFLPAADGDLLWVMVYLKAEDARLHALVELGRETRALGEFAPAPAPMEGDPAPAEALAQSLDAFLLAQEERIAGELAAPRG